MTLFNPNLEVTSLEIFRRGHCVYDEKFHSGLNIIRGENSSGKSTIMDFIFYGLGGDLLDHQWRESALLCDTVVMGVKLCAKGGTPISQLRADWARRADSGDGHVNARHLENVG